MCNCHHGLLGYFGWGGAAASEPLDTDASSWSVPPISRARLMNSQCLIHSMTLAEIEGIPSDTTTAGEDVLGGAVQARRAPAVLAAGELGAKVLGCSHL